jgi:GNAT superfamily N-acetyltransferase
MICGVFFLQLRQDVQIVEVKPQTSAWHQFLQLTHIYLRENWPESIEADSAVFLPQHASELEERIKQGGRGLFLLQASDKNIGIANVYLDADHRRLNVAEFYIIPSERMQGLGRSFLAGLLTWGAQHGVREIRLEADKGQAAANSFWLRMPLRLDSSSNRNVYHGDLEQVLTLLRVQDATRQEGSRACGHSSRGNE